MQHGKKKETLLLDLLALTGSLPEKTRLLENIDIPRK